MDQTYAIKELDNNYILDYCFKVVISGNSGVGKTSIVSYEINNIFDPDNESTIIFEHFYKNYKMCDKIIRLQMWDTCCEENYETLMSSFYRSALCILIVFAIDDDKSFFSLNKWISDIKISGEKESPMIILVGNKIDNGNKRKVSKRKLNNIV